MKKSRSFAGGFRVKMSDRLKAKVVTLENFIYEVEVDWETRKVQCSCQRPRQTKLPCGHVIAILLDQKKELSDFIPWAWSCYNWITQHSTPLPVICVGDLFAETEHPCFPPYTRTPRGQSRNKRLWAGHICGRRRLAF